MLAANIMTRQTSLSAAEARIAELEQTLAQREAQLLDLTDQLFIEDNGELHGAEYWKEQHDIRLAQLDTEIIRADKAHAENNQLRKSQEVDAKAIRKLKQELDDERKAATKKEKAQWETIKQLRNLKSKKRIEELEAQRASQQARIGMLESEITLEPDYVADIETRKQLQSILDNTPVSAAYPRALDDLLDETRYKILGYYK